jgi:hypothetical protein
MLVCTLDMEMIINSTIYYQLTLVADGKIIDTLSSWSVNVTLANDGIHTINYDFHGHYFALADLSLTNITSGIALNVSTIAATLSPETNYVYYYDPLVLTTVTISVILSVDPTAILYSIA